MPASDWTALANNLRVIYLNLGIFFRCQEEANIAIDDCPRDSSERPTPSGDQAESAERTTQDMEGDKAEVPLN
ncbi:hypothetical protein DPMN_119694 [Dreissena polymorpha]|uniref:Uncharacterized protein n=1 Tax=Dreissena polymorpha TaxID=45954 RepID=A0A9D4GM62_DREPO|nr:hypothetical protein DPMN_119694 [Dreissena polymorpha]